MGPVNHPGAAATLKTAAARRDPLRSGYGERENARESLSAERHSRPARAGASDWRRDAGSGAHHVSWSTDSRHSLESTSMDIRPLHDRIIVQRLEEGEQKIGGIIIPDTAKEKPQQGKVIAAGNGKVNDDGQRVPLDVKAGDLILFGKYTSQEVKLDGEEYLIMREDEVLAIIDGGGTTKGK
jgi:chaperonin GroES